MCEDSWILGYGLVMKPSHPRPLVRTALGYSGPQHYKGCQREQLHLANHNIMTSDEELILIGYQHCHSQKCIDGCSVTYSTMN